MTSQDGSDHGDSESRQIASSREEERASERAFTLSDLVAAIHAILRILSKIVYVYKGGSSVHLPNALWAYRTSLRSATGFLPYSLVYGSDAISTVEITALTAKVSAVNDHEWDAKSCSDWRLLDLETVDG
ncbi:hypothetical protein L3X38_016189 [Prunus dulcis]|uniref:Uncharacterized protein n=1 Tax=Prunus dulcis TaxID=3755 RepID=A0AAD4W4V6_PRUDU|nr:hypothetical protein L3X38_016189 [Prunus dulcis]